MFYFTRYIQNTIVSICNQSKRCNDKFSVHLLVLNLGTPACILQLTAHVNSDSVNSVASYVTAQFYRNHEMLKA